MMLPLDAATAASARMPIRRAPAATPVPSVPHRFAWQPIVEAGTWTTYACEALVRGIDGGSAATVFAAVPKSALHAFDEKLRIGALRDAARLGLECNLTLNFMPRSLHHSEHVLDSTIDAARQNGIAIERIIIEMSETELVDDRTGFARIMNRYRALGLKVAIDDFGAGYSGLNLLADFQPDFVKLDMNLVRGIERHGPRQAIVRAIHNACLDLGIELVAEGVETEPELQWFRRIGVMLFQGYLFSRPVIDRVPGIWHPGSREAA